MSYLDELKNKFNVTHGIEEYPDSFSSDLDELLSQPKKRHEDTEITSISKKDRKKALSDLFIQLKLFAKDPSLLEIEDSTAEDPFLLTTLRCDEAAVPPPSHWATKKKFLKHKKGSETVSYSLPFNISATGVGDLTQFHAERLKLAHEAKQAIKPKSSELMSLEAQSLFNAFYGSAAKDPRSKPRLTPFGELYKENSSLLARTVPGIFSDRLIFALGMKSQGDPPPWLEQMKRIGPPPAFPDGVYYGVNVGLPPGSKWGDKWGAPPLNESGVGLWGDVLKEGPALAAQTYRWGVK